MYFEDLFFDGKFSDCNVCGPQIPQYPYITDLGGQQCYLLEILYDSPLSFSEFIDNHADLMPYIIALNYEKKIFFFWTQFYLVPKEKIQKDLCVNPNEKFHLKSIIDVKLGYQTHYSAEKWDYIISRSYARINERSLVSS